MRGRSPFNAPGGGCEAAGDQTKWSPFTSNEMAQREAPGQISCGVVNEFLTNFEDLMSVYQFGIQIPAIASRILALTTPQSISSNMNGMGSDSASSKYERLFMAMNSEPSGYFCIYMSRISFKE